MAEVASVPVCRGGSGNSTFAAVARRAYLYVGNVNLDTDENVIRGYLENKFQNNEFIVDPLPMREGAQSRAFKLTFDYSLLDDLNKPELWPSGVVVKRFFRAGPRKQ